MEYILFVAREGNFQIRSMLIPKKEFLEVRLQDYQLLKSSAQNLTYFNNGKNCNIFKCFLPNEYENINEVNIRQTIKPYTELCNLLTAYSDGIDDGYYYDNKDKVWYDLAKCELCRGFDYVDSFITLRQLTEYEGNPIKITDSFLFMEL